MRLLLLAVTCALLSLLFPGHSAALKVGGAPHYVQAGEIRAGDSKLVSFWLGTDSGNDLVVDLYTRDASREFYDPNRARGRYVFVPEEASEESSSTWIDFMKNPEVLPAGMYYEPAVNAYVNKKVEAIVKVPADAEPGYHVGYFTPSPRVSSATGDVGGAALMFISLVEIGYIFRVEGEAVRHGRVVGFDYVRGSPDTQTVSVLFKNTGTVTITAEAASVEIYNSTGRVAALKSGAVKVRPGDIAPLEVSWDVRGVELGEYRVVANVSWMTGYEESGGVIEVTEYAGPPPVTAGVVTPGEEAGPVFPLWIAPIIILIFALIIYRRYR